MKNDFESNYLAHHQRKGAKWGIMNGPPYPLGADQLTAAEKKHGGVAKSLKEAYKNHKRKKQRKKALEKAQAVRKAKAEEKRKQEEFAKKKEEILKSGDPNLIMKYRKQLTDNELSNAVSRIRSEQAMKEFIASSQKSGFDKIDGVMQKAGKVTDWAKKGVDGYNTIAKIYNAFNAKDEESLLPIIGQDNLFVSKDKDSKKKAYEAEKDKINKEWTMKYGKAQNDWKMESDRREREWREKMMRAGYKP